MVHIPSAYTYNFWAKSPTEVVELTCLMPNGVIIPLETNRNITLAEIKEVSETFCILLCRNDDPFLMVAQN